MLSMFAPSLLMYFLTPGRINKYLNAEYQTKSVHTYSNLAVWLHAINVLQNKAIAQLMCDS